MKTKALILIAFAAIITLSFSFAASTGPKKTTGKITETTSISQSTEEPLGGFISEDKF